MYSKYCGSIRELITKNDIPNYIINSSDIIVCINIVLLDEYDYHTLSLAQLVNNRIVFNYYVL